MRSGVVLGMGVLLLAGCVDGGSGGGSQHETAKRPPVSVPDQVTTVNRSLVLGTWTCRELNPYPQVPTQTSQITYNADGTFASTGQSAPHPPFGAMTIKATGRWSVEGEHLVTSGVKTEASSQDAFTNVMAGIGTSIANTFMAQKEGSANVLKLTRTELVYTPIGVDDPPVISCTR